MSHASDIVRHYADKNLPWPEFKRAIERHVRLLRVLDPMAAHALTEEPLCKPPRMAHDEPGDAMPAWPTADFAAMRREYKKHLVRPRVQSRWGNRGGRIGEKQQPGT